MITYEVPLERFPETYNDKPLMYAALASQKNHMSLYLMGCYMSPDIRKNFEDAYKKSGKKFDAGKSCIRFKKVQDLSLELIGKTIGSMSVELFWVSSTHDILFVINLLRVLLALIFIFAFKKLLLSPKKYSLSLESTKFK